MSKIQSLKSELKLEGNNSEVRKGFVKKMKEIHPDNNGGDFNSEEEKLLYTQLGDAIKEINEDQLPVISNSEIVAMVKSISINNNKVDPNKNLELKTDKSYLNYRGKHFFPKISITAITSLISIIWLFPNQLSEHAVLSKFIDVESPVFNAIWLYSLFFTGLYWFVFNSRERNQKEFLSRINTEEYQSKLFHGFIRDLDEGNYFTKSDFIQFLMHGNTKFHRNRKLFDIIRGSLTMNLEVSQSIADIVFLRAEEKEVIKKVDTKSLMDHYILDYS